MVNSENGVNVLVVDPDPYVNRVIGALVGQNSEVTTASNSRAGRRAASVQNFDLILWDLRMDRCVDELPVVRAICPDALIVATTSEIKTITVASVAHMGVDYVLHKPYGMDALSDLMPRVLSADRHSANGPTSDIMNTGQKITILADSIRHVTRVMNVTQDSIMVVGGSRVNFSRPLRRGMRLTIETTGLNGVYCGSSRFLHTVTDPVDGFELIYPTRFIRLQRRVHPRFAVEPGTEATVIMQDGKMLAGAVSNISVGGSALVIRGTIDPGTRLSVNYRLGNMEYSVSAIVVRCSHADTVGLVRLMIKHNELDAEQSSQFSNWISLSAFASQS